MYINLCILFSEKLIKKEIKLVYIKLCIPFSEKVIKKEASMGDPLHKYDYDEVSIM